MVSLPGRCLMLRRVCIYHARNRERTRLGPTSQLGVQPIPVRVTRDITLFGLKDAEFAGSPPQVRSFMNTSADFRSKDNRISLV